MPPIVPLVGVLLLAGGGVWWVWGRGPRIPYEVRRPGAEPPPTVLQRYAKVATSMVDAGMRRRGAPEGTSLFELAGMRMRPPEFVLLVIIASLVGFAAGLTLINAILGLVLAGLCPVAARLGLGFQIKRRQKKFDGQLSDTLALMASALRAGHSLPQALSSVAKDSAKPTSEEFTRVVNEVRVGRSLIESLGDTAARMQSQDFKWVAQAIAINREIGGNLAEVLDQVTDTIRQRNAIKRLVNTLAAEGKLSAVILIGLPFLVAGFLLFSNPEYLAPMFEDWRGMAMLGFAGVQLAIGSFWLSKTVQIKF